MMAGMRMKQCALDHDVPPCLGRDIRAHIGKVDPPDIIDRFGIHEFIRVASHRYRFVENENSRMFYFIAFRIFSVARRTIERLNDNNAGQTDNGRVIVQRFGCRGGSPNQHPP